MDLKTYLDQPGHTQAALAEAIAKTPGPKGCTQGLVSQWSLGHLRVTAERAVQIEEATDGAITRHELRPDLYPKPPAAKGRARARA